MPSVSPSKEKLCIVHFRQLIQQLINARSKTELERSRKRRAGDQNELHLHFTSSQRAKIFILHVQVCPRPPATSATSVTYHAWAGVVSTSFTSLLLALLHFISLLVRYFSSMVPVMSTSCAHGVTASVSIAPYVTPTPRIRACKPFSQRRT